MAEKKILLKSGNVPDWLANTKAVLTKNGDLKLIPENNEPVSVFAITPRLKIVSKRAIANNFAGVLV